jgi:hypothetical protein
MIVVPMKSKQHVMMKENWYEKDLMEGKQDFWIKIYDRYSNYQIKLWENLD